MTLNDFWGIYKADITRKEGSYGKILSDAFVQILDGNHAIEQEALQQNLSECVTEQMQSMADMPAQGWQEPRRALGERLMF